MYIRSRKGLVQSLTNQERLHHKEGDDITGNVNLLSDEETLSHFSSSRTLKCDRKHLRAAPKSGQNGIIPKSRVLFLNVTRPPGVESAIKAPSIDALFSGNTQSECETTLEMTYVVPNIFGKLTDGLREAGRKK